MHDSNLPFYKSKLEIIKLCIRNSCIFKSITLYKFNEGEIKVLKNGLIELMEVAEEQATEESSRDSQDTTALGTLTSTPRATLTGFNTKCSYTMES